MLENIKNNPYFSEKTLKTWEYLFHEWESDSNIYIIENWELTIEKNLENTQKKYLASLWKNDILWEGWLSKHFKKDVSIKAIKNSKLFYIAVEDFEAFTKEFPKLAQQFLTQIIRLSNHRLLHSNELVIKNYELAKLVAQATDFSNATLFHLLDTLKEKLHCDSILFFERNPVLENYLSFRYTTEEQEKMKDEVFELEYLNEETLKNNNIKTEGQCYIAELRNNNKNTGFLVFTKKSSDFSELTKKVIDSLAITLAGYVKQKQNIENA